MPERYGTRSTTKAARSRATIAGSPRASEHSSSSTAAVPLAGSSRHTPEEAAASGLPPRTNNGRRPLTAPSPFHLAVDGGQQRGQETTPAILHLPGKRALVHNSAVPPSATSVPTTAGAAQVGAEYHPPSGAKSRRKRSRLSLGLSRHRVSIPQQTVAAPAVLAPIGDVSSKSRSTGAYVGCFPGGISPRLSEGCVGSAERPRSTSPPPPFVGLKNLGETCYVNAVLQALAACRASLKSGRGTAVAAGDAGKAGDRQGEDEDEGLGSSSAAPVHTAEDFDLSSVDMASTGVQAGANGNPVFLALGKALGDMEARNRTLYEHQQQQQSPELPVGLSTDPGIPVLADDGSPEMPVRPSDQTPRRPDVPAREDDVCAGAITPDALVELIREGWLSAERSTGEVPRRLLRRLGGGSAGAGDDFGNGQACASELQGKLLDVCAATAAAGAVQDGRGDDRLGGTFYGSDGRRRSYDSGVCGLASAFRGTLCARTHCVECERDRTSREEFTELTLPPLVPLPLPPPPAQPPSPKRVAVRAVAAGISKGDLSKPQQEVRTLQSLVDAMLGRESLEGKNKVWCEACRQWNEAERRSSLCSPPALLALHVRPGTRKQSSPCPYPAAPIVAAGGAFRKQPDGAGRAGDRRGPCGAEQALAAHDENGELIERVLVVKSAVRCQSHAAEASGNGSTSSAPNRELQPPRAAAKGGKSHRPQGKKQHRRQPSDSGDVFYDLIGAILHQGQTLGSGHYTFVLHAGGTPSYLSDQPPTCHHHHHPPSAGDRSSASGGRGCSASSAGVTDREIPGLTLLVPGLVGEGEAGGSVAGGASCKKPGFALFDDDVVRWLSLEEESAVLRGGGRAIGDPFLVFYARRE